MHPESTKQAMFYQQLADDIKTWGKELGFQHIGITDVELGPHKQFLQEWLDKGYHGEMAWMKAHQPQRNDPSTLVPEAIRIISARMDYLPENTQQVKILKQPEKAYISRYALGRDYHKLIRKRLATLAKKIQQTCDENKEHSSAINQRPFVDSAPVLEKAFAEKAGLGWIGKHTVLLNASVGSWFFLGELMTNLPLPIDQQQSKNQCGDCEACLKICPTDAFVAPYKLDATRCISYLTIELKEAIPLEFREAMGNRVFGCDDCQLICPWNKYAKPTNEKDFSPRHELNDTDLVTLFLWTEEEYLKNTEGSAIRRIGYERWLRNLAVGLGNAKPTADITEALKKRADFPSSMVQEHVSWALEQHKNPKKRRVRKIKRPS
ncbi:MAG: tRNA epoxyqueuosine(34) reductase QueG [Cellvibrionaceae bacterium]